MAPFYNNQTIYLDLIKKICNFHKSFGILIEAVLIDNCLAKMGTS